MQGITGHPILSLQVDVTNDSDSMSRDVTPWPVQVWNGRPMQVPTLDGLFSVFQLASFSSSSSTPIHFSGKRNQPIVLLFPGLQVSFIEARRA